MWSLLTEGSGRQLFSKLSFPSLTERLQDSSHTTPSSSLSPSGETKHFAMSQLTYGFVWPEPNTWQHSPIHFVIFPCGCKLCCSFSSISCILKPSKQCLKLSTSTMFPSITLTWLLLQCCSKATWHLVSQEENRISRDTIPALREALIVPWNAILISQDEKIMSFPHESCEIPVVEPKVSTGFIGTQWRRRLSLVDAVSSASLSSERMRGLWVKHGLNTWIL